jgi:4-hydroxymandelate oxidase
MASAGGAGFGGLADLEAAAGRKANPAAWAYVQGGAGDESSLRANRRAFDRWTLRPRALADIAVIDPTTSLLGTSVTAPFYVAPTAYHGELDRAGEVGTARAAAAAGVLAMFSTLSTRSLEEIGAAVPRGPRWFQIYLQPDFRATRRLVERAEAAGFGALVLTVDLPVLANRDRQAEGGFAFDGTTPMGNGPDLVLPPRGPVRDGLLFRIPGAEAYTWRVLDDLRSITRLPVVVKGILTDEDARRSVDCGARAVVVSNHGGRQLDGAPAGLDVLPEVVAEVGSRAEVYLDGGVRRGRDILIALGLGARAVGLGRPILWGLAAGGEAGVSRVIELLRMELATVMALSGRARVDAIDRTLVAAAPSTE